MGLYLNGMTKSSETNMIWFSVNGNEWNAEWDFEKCPEGEYICVAVDNGAFIAFGVAYDKREYEVFRNPDDKRRKYWRTLPLKVIKEYAPNWADYIRGIEHGE